MPATRDGTEHNTPPTEDGCPCHRPYSRPTPTRPTAPERCDLASAGLPGYCATIAINASGEEVLLLAAYDQGEADYLTDWSRVAPHDDLSGLPVYWRED